MKRLFLFPGSDISKKKNPGCNVERRRSIPSHDVYGALFCYVKQEAMYAWQVVCRYDENRIEDQ
jgi:hypothetical protein